MQELNKIPLVDILSEQLGKQVVMNGDKYVYLDTKDEVEASIISDAVIKNDNDFLQLSKDTKVKEINTACGNEIENGFVSDALGTEHTYQSEQIDQLNLIGLVASGTDDYFKTGVTDANGNITWNYELHTIEQLKLVLDDGKAYKQALLLKANTLKSQVAEAITVEEIEAIVWQK